MSETVLCCSAHGPAGISPLKAHFQGFFIICEHMSGLQTYSAAATAPYCKRLNIKSKPKWTLGILYVSLNYFHLFIAPLMDIPTDQ